MFNFRRRETPWEVVDSKAVEPVPLYYEYEDDDLDIVTVGEANTRRTYVFDVNSSKKNIDLRDTVVFAQQQLLQETIKKGFNILLFESWQLTIYRRGKQRRIEVQYSARPGVALGKLPTRRSPPFVSVLHGCN